MIPTMQEGVKKEKAQILVSEGVISPYSDAA